MPDMSYMTGYGSPGLPQGAGTMSGPLIAASILANTAGSIWGGQGQPDPKDAGDAHLVNMGQQNLWNSMYGKLMSGAGDFGAGQGIKQGKSQLQQFMADRGIAPDGGAGIGAYANMVGQAQAGANQNRLGYAMNLLRSPLQTMQTAGSNYLPNSPSYGYDADAQRDHFVYGRRQHFNPLLGGNNLMASYNQDGSGQIPLPGGG